MNEWNSYACPNSIILKSQQKGNKNEKSTRITKVNQVNIFMIMNDIFFF